MSNSSKIKKIAIVGGGAAGLCAAKYMISSTEGMFRLEPVVFEQRNTVGGTWVYEDVEESSNGDVFSSIYKNLRTNLPKQIMIFPDFPFPEDLPSFMGHSDVRKYLNNYAEHYQLHKHIRFRTKVIDVEPLFEPKSQSDQTEHIWNDGGTKWCVTSQNLRNGEMSKMIFDGVVICNGHFSQPYIPNIPGFVHYRKTYMHSHYYREPEQFEGKNVLVLGFGPTGNDISLELSNTCSKVYVAHKGERCQSKLPDNLMELPDLSHVNKEGLFVFVNGEVIDVDVLLLCTGYLVDLSFINKKFKIDIEEERVVKGLYKHLFFISNPSLCIVGLPWRINSFPVSHLQCAYIASVFSGYKKLPSNYHMIQDTENEERELTLANQPLKYFHKFGTRQFQYCDSLVSLSGCEPNPPFIKNLHIYIYNKRRTDLMSYKKLEFKLVNNEEFEILNS